MWIHTSRRSPTGEALVPGVQSVAQYVVVGLRSLSSWCVVSISCPMYPPRAIVPRDSAPKWSEKNTVSSRQASQASTGHETNLGYRDCAETPELTNNLALKLLVLACVLLPFKGVDPPNISHGCPKTLDVELVLEGNWEPMQRTHQLPMFCIEVIQLLCSRDGVVKSDLEEKIALSGPARQ